MTQEMLRNVDNVTLGDYTNFEYFQSGKWLHAGISRNAIVKLRAGDDTKDDITVVRENQERIWRATLEHLGDPGVRQVLLEDHV